MKFNFINGFSLTGHRCYLKHSHTVTSGNVSRNGKACDGNYSVWNNIIKKLCF